MEATELRIGNYVFYNGQPIEVSANDILVLEKKVNGWLYYSPIQINTEIFYKSGFKFADYLNTKTRYSKGNFHMDLSKKKWYLHGYRGHKAGLQYLHQLQNLYYALTGEELSIQL